MYDWAVSRPDVYTNMEVLTAYADRFEEDKLRGAIFHMSRCGSTAIANAFRAVERVLVISESRILTSIILPEAYGGIAASAPIKTLLAKSFIAAVLKECPARGVVIKFPSFVSTGISDALMLLPVTRWCFSSRRPCEVIRSLEASKGGWLAHARGRKKAEAMLGLSVTEGETDLSRARELYAHLLEKYLEAAVSAMEPRAVCLDYADFGDHSVSAVVGFMLDDELDVASRSRIVESLQFYSKSLDRRPFIPSEDVGGKVTGFPYLDQAYERYLRALYAGHDGARNAAAGIVKTFDGSL
jgi:hypothetical protein